jgi:hypothetical protein
MDRARLIAETANRMRVAQLDLSDQEPEMRAACVADMLDEALKSDQGTDAQIRRGILRLLDE